MRGSGRCRESGIGRITRSLKSLLFLVIIRNFIFYLDFFVDSQNPLLYPPIRLSFFQQRKPLAGMADPEGDSWKGYGNIQTGKSNAQFF